MKTPPENRYKRNISILILLLRSFLRLIIFRRNLVDFKNAARKLKINKNKTSINSLQELYVFTDDM